MVHIIDYRQNMKGIIFTHKVQQGYKKDNRPTKLKVWIHTIMHVYFSMAFIV